MINTYISDLLYRYECVIVPEFGAFLTQQQSAVIDVATNVFLPPNKAISFNEQLQQNDGLLANHIRVNEDCTYAEAVSKINNFVAQTKSILITGEVVLLPKIGHFSLNTDGKLQFSVLDEVNYLTTSFGLSTVAKVPVLREVYKEEIEVLEEKAPIVFIPETRKKRKKKPYLRYASVAVVALGMFGFFGKNYVDGKLIEVDENNAEVHVKANKKAYAKASFFDVAPIEIPAATLPITVKSKGKYHIVAGAFRFEENADKKIIQLESQGFEAHKIGVNAYGLHQVVYASYADRLESLAALREVKRNHNAQAWLLVKVFD